MQVKQAPLPIAGKLREGWGQRIAGIGSPRPGGRATSLGRERDMENSVVFTDCEITAGRTAASVSAGASASSGGGGPITFVDAGIILRCGRGWGRSGGRLGRTSVVAVPDSPSLHSGREITITGWFRTDGFTRYYQNIFFKGGPGDSGG